MRIKNEILDMMDMNMKTTNNFKNRFQRVRLGDTLSSWQSITKGVLQGSILGPLLFKVFMNDLSYVIKESTLSTYADDTQIFYADNDLPRVEETINHDLASADKWFAQNGTKRNSSTRRWCWEKTKEPSWRSNVMSHKFPYPQQWNFSV